MPMRLNIIDGVLIVFLLLTFTALFVTLENLPWYQQRLTPAWKVVEVDFFVVNQSGWYVNEIVPGLEEVRNGELRGRVLAVNLLPELSNISKDSFAVLVNAKVLAKDFDSILTYEKKSLHFGASIVFTTDQIRLDGVVKDFRVLENETNI